MLDIESRQRTSSSGPTPAAVQPLDGVNSAGHAFSSTYHTEQATRRHELEMKPGDVNSGGQREAVVFKQSGSKKVKQSFSQTRMITGVVLMLVATLGMFIFTELTTIDIFFWLFFFGMFWYRLDSRISIGGALVGLVGIMFLSAGQGFGWWKADNLMEQIAVGVYFFLVIGVVKQIWEYRTEN